MMNNDALLKQKIKLLSQIDRHEAKKLKKRKKRNLKKKNEEKLGKISEASIKFESGLYDDRTDIEYFTPEIKDETFEEVFNKFKLKNLKNEEEVEVNDIINDEKSVNSNLEDSDVEHGDAIESKKKSRQEIKKNRPTLIELKRKSLRPDVVETWDVTAVDPDLLIWLKSYRCSVSVPNHWDSKRKYLQGKRGFEKQPFKLPHYVEATRISEIRAALLEKEARKTIKQKQREKIRPKLHKMDIDYQTLHDAFFKYATKPYLTKFGDIYYEGKEFEIKANKYMPGRLSERLIEALGMQPNWPAPWIFNMQKYGPPPAYPNQRIPGVNVPIKPGCEFGFKPGEWGKPPVDELGNPLWGLLPPEDEGSHVTALAAAPFWGELDDKLDDDLDLNQNVSDSEHEMDQSHASHKVSSKFSGPVHNIAPSIIHNFNPTELDTSKLLSLPEVSQQRYASADGGKLFQVLEPVKSSSIEPHTLFGSSVVYNVKK